MGRQHQTAIDAKRGVSRDRSEREDRSVNLGIDTPRKLPAGFEPIGEVAAALGTSEAALQRAIDRSGRVRQLIARDGVVHVHHDEALAVGRSA